MNKLQKREDNSIFSSYFEPLKKDLKSKSYSSTIDIAKAITDYIHNIIDKIVNATKSINGLHDSIKKDLKLLTSINVMQFTIGNTLKRILHIIDLYRKSDNDLKSIDNQIFEIKQDIEHLKCHYEKSSDSLIDIALNFIEEGDVILTANYSDQLYFFLKKASENLKFTVIVAESYPSLKGEEMAFKLNSININSVIISDSSVFAVMPKITKVMIGTRAVMANGGLISYNGVYNICLAAKSFNVPVLVLSGSYKLTPLYPFDHLTFNEQLSPDSIYFCNFKGNLKNITFNAPAYDYVPPEFITIYLTDQGDYHPSYIYRLFKELYSEEDYN